MDVSLMKNGGAYEVHAESGKFYDGDVAAQTCTYLDWQRREPKEGCKLCVMLISQSGQDTPTTKWTDSSHEIGTTAEFNTVGCQ